MTGWLVTIGLEVHCQLATRTKMFSACPFHFGASPNTLTDAYTLALPGSLPVANREAIELGLRLALALGAEVAPRSVWARKHYFYPDLPKGYQITQADPPLARGGSIEVAPGRRVGLLRIHLEEDAGKLVHPADPAVSLVDFNRAGAPLLEVVGEPTIASPAEAAAFLRQLRAIVRALGISAADMQEGTLRCDANVSLRAQASDGLGARCEVKNLNSFKFLERALAAEIRRQTRILADGGVVTPATLRYDVPQDRTVVMRSKESAAEYRYLPEPDLPPLEVDAAWIARVRAALPALPPPGAREAPFRGSRAPDERRDGDGSRPHAVARPHAVEVAAASGRRERASVRAAPTLHDAAALAAAAEAVLQRHPRPLAQYLAGKAALRDFFVGELMRATARQADPLRAREIIEAALARAARGTT